MILEIQYEYIGQVIIDLEPFFASDASGSDDYEDVTTTTAPSEDFTTVTAPEASTTTFTTLQVPTGIDCNDGNNGGCQHTCFYPDDATNDEDAECECDECFFLTNGFDCEPIPACEVSGFLYQYQYNIFKFFLSCIRLSSNLEPL